MRGGRDIDTCDGGNRALRTNRRGGFEISLFCAAVVALTGCPRGGGGYGGGAPGGPPSAPVPVVVAAAAQQTVPILITTFGRGEAYTTVNVRAQVGGTLSEVRIKEGQDVKSGDVLFIIDRRPFEAALKLAQADLTRDQASAELADVELRRTEQLFKNSAASKDDLDKARATADAAAATVRADAAAVDNAALQLGYCTITSPVDGRTGVLYVDQGNYVKANDVILITIDRIKPINVTFSVPERELPGIRKYMAQGPLKVTCEVPGEESQREEGTLAFVDNNVDASTGTVLLKATFDNAGARLWPGQYVDVVLTLAERANAVVVPSPAIQVSQSRSYVFVVKADRTVETRPVKQGAMFDGHTVVEEGLSAGETVVTDGQLRLVPGARIEAKEAPGGEGAPAK